MSGFKFFGPSLWMKRDAICSGIGDRDNIFVVRSGQWRKVRLLWQSRPGIRKLMVMK